MIERPSLETQPNLFQIAITADVPRPQRGVAQRDRGGDYKHADSD
jgi:hypothetical protein